MLVHHRRAVVVIAIRVLNRVFIYRVARCHQKHAVIQIAYGYGYTCSCGIEVDEFIGKTE
ncbi:hypothetical protein D3C84_1066410 [compost metagenome]